MFPKRSPTAGLLMHGLGLEAVEASPQSMIGLLLASERAQSVPKRSGTTRLLVARSGTNWLVKGYTSCLTSVLASTDNAEVGGSIPPSPTSGEGIPAGKLPFRG